MWIASNLSIPFWAVGHIHLTMNVYEDIKEIIASFGMNILVATGFYLDNAGQFSLKDKLSWNGTTLIVSGTILWPNS